MQRGNYRVYNFTFCDKGNIAFFFMAIFALNVDIKGGF
jgi:hypothetical protein